VPLPAALDAAHRAGQDLVEVAPQADPPVVRIMDYGKYEYEQSVKARAGKKRTGGSVKEMKYRPNIGDHDFDTKTRKVADFLEKGNKVKVTVWLRGRERSMPGLATEVVDRVVTELDEMLDDEVVLEAPVRGDGPQRSAMIATGSD
jgi:translation initiation factor IF-3